jgi:membrane-bound lytic murein transglycosylase B
MHLTPLRPARAGLTLVWFALACCAPGGAQAGKKSPVVARADAAPDVVTYGRRDDVVAFARQAAEVRGLDADWAIAQLAQARYQPSVARLVMPPPAGVAKNWGAYRARFVEPQRIREGLRWWQANEAALAQAEARWGVPAEMVTAIVGVETFYGRIVGSYKVVDALATLAFDFPSGRSDRSSFYRDELGAFLQWCSTEGRDPQAVKGSYAGAIGLPQFMPSSILKYAIDFDNDGRVDLDTHGADVVGSVAHYFAQFGWQRDLPTHYPVAPPSKLSERALLLVPEILPSFSPAQFTEHGAVLDEAGRAHSEPLALVELQNGDAAASYVAGTRNFYVVTRYNWSSYYAMAVIELARAMKQMRPPPAAE